MADTIDYWKIDEELIKRVAKNARLELTEQEIEKFTKQLEDILSAFKKINEVDTAKTEPSFHPQEIKNVMREDKAKKWEWDPLANTKQKENSYFKGPRAV